MKTECLIKIGVISLIMVTACTVYAQDPVQIYCEGNMCDNSKLNHGIISSSYKNDQTINQSSGSYKTYNTITYGQPFKFFVTDVPSPAWKQFGSTYTANSTWTRDGCYIRVQLNESGGKVTAGTVKNCVAYSKNQ